MSLNWAVCILAVVGCESASDEKTQRGEPIDQQAVDKPLFQSPAPHFEERAVQSGLIFTPTNGQSAGHFAILETLGSGAACFDYDRDGDPDAFILGGGEFDDSPAPIGRPAALFRNDGGLAFVDVSKSAHLRNSDLYSHGAITADYDGDGFDDVLVTGFGGLRLMRNMGDGSFDEIHQAAGLSQKKWSTGAAWGDFNFDGNLDLFVVNYVDWSFANHPRCADGANAEVCTPGIFDAQRDRLYLSDGAGRFTDGSEQYGLAGDGKGLAAISVDVDSDGDLDVYVANDTTPNFLYRNDRDRFVEIGLQSGTSLNANAEADGSMGIDVADFDADGRCDICVANYEKQFFALYRQSSELGFDHVSSHVGLTKVGQVFVGFGTVFLDVDSDGDEDIFVTNGHVMRNPRNSSVMQLPILYQNNDGKFDNRAAESGDYLRSPHMGRGIAVSDLDLDGDTDAIVTHIDQPVALLENRSVEFPHWISIQLTAARSHRSGLGARIEIDTIAGVQTRWTKNGGSFLSSSDSRVLFGLGEAQAVDRLVVHWPSGNTDTHRNLTCNQLIAIREGDHRVYQLEQ